MKKILFFLFLSLGIYGYGQTGPIKDDQKKTIGGFFDNAFDQYGNSYNISYLQVSQSKNNPNGKIAATSTTAGMFELYFETGCGMEAGVNSIYDARRTVACRVFQDLSDFINSPLKNVGNTNKVRIWVRKISNINGIPSGVLGFASPFYNMPFNSTAGFGGIADNEIWKTIHAGKDSYINVATPMSVSSTTPNPSGLYYHGMMAFDFEHFTWNTNLTTTAPSGSHDLYSVILHEVTHALGFASLINANGQSQFGTIKNYYSRYDTFLKNNATSEFLIKKNATASSNMYNYGFNPALNINILKPNTSNCITDQTTCSTAIKFVGTTTTSVYTPNCFEEGSSLSHFEDQCLAPNIGDAYFAMSNAESGTVNTKRFLKPEERNALSDIGYSLNITYGNNTNAFGSFKNYGGSTSTGITVAGINDGITTTGLYSFIGNTATTITISGLLTNDTNATGFEGLQDVYDPLATLSTISGTATTTVNFISNVAGLHLLRYVPINATGQKGNITYVYVYVNGGNNCATPTANDLVLNGDFEQYSTLPGDLSEFDKVCGWNSMSQTTPDYFRVDALNTRFGAPNSIVSVPCNFAGTQSENSGKKAYAGMLIIKHLHKYNDDWFESLRTKLATPLLPNTEYTLSFDVSLAETRSENPVKIQAYLSTTLIVPSGLGGIPISNPNMFFKNPTYSTRKTDEWEKIIFTFTTGSTAGEQYLYLGGLNNVEFMTNPQPVVEPACSYSLGDYFDTFQYRSYYYVDNVSLVPTNGAKFSLPPPICVEQSLADLKSYLVAAPLNGVFSGTGVVNTAGIYSFNASIAGRGVHSITYTYTNSGGNSVALKSNITVLDSTIPLTPITICSGTAINLPSPLANGITGSWLPAVNNLATTIYTFTPNPGQCAGSTTLTVTVNPKTTPTFDTTVNCWIFPTTSMEGITGSWSTPINTPETTTSTFTPDAGQCANSTTLTVILNPKTTPTFEIINPACFNFPTSSDEGISGSWSPAINNSVTTTYTFTPNEGQCANTTTFTGKVNTVTPTFASIATVCPGSPLELSSTSTNGITGRWNDETDGTIYETTTFTFTPDANQCASIVTLTIKVFSECYYDDGSEGCDISSLVLSSPQTVNFNYDRRHDWIETNTNYSVSSGKEGILIAGNYIELKPNTHLASGSEFLARIEECVYQTWEKVKNPKTQNLDPNTQNLDTEIDSVIFYPNPTKDVVTISTKTLKIIDIMLVSLGGQVLTTVHNINTTPYLLDLTQYPTGTYIAIVKTADGNEIKQKIIKK